MFKKTYFCFYLVSITISVMVFSYLFQKTDGLLYVMGSTKEGEVILKYVSELLSSGAEDSNLIGLFDWFYIPVILLYLFKCRLTKLILGAFVLIVSLQIFSFMMIDVGSVVETIIYGKNYILLAWSVSYLLLIGAMLYGFLNYKRL